MDKDAKAELVSAIRQRYGQARKKDKSRILDEFVAITGHHRKYAIRLALDKELEDKYQSAMKEIEL